MPRSIQQVFSLINSAPVEKLAGFENQSVELHIKRDDLIHPVISGNKWHKLKYLLLHLQSQGYRKIATMGGHYSNFLHVLAFVANQLNWQATFYIRGHQEQPLTPTLQDIIEWGAKLVYTSREDFRGLREAPPDLPEDTYWISEGGMDEYAIKGFVDSVADLDEVYDYWVIASATGTSLAGYQMAVNQNQLKTKVIGIPVLNNADAIRQNVKHLIGEDQQPELIEGYEFGGFAKSNDELLEFINQFEQQHSIPLEPVYTGKSFYAVNDLINKGYFPSGSKILLIHCGGLQGRRG